MKVLKAFKISQTTRFHGELGCYAGKIYAHLDYRTMEALSPPLRFVLQTSTHKSAYAMHYTPFDLKMMEHKGLKSDPFHIMSIFQISRILLHRKCTNSFV